MIEGPGQISVLFNPEQELRMDHIMDTIKYWVSECELQSYAQLEAIYKVPAISRIR